MAIYHIVLVYILVLCPTLKMEGAPNRAPFMGFNNPISLFEQLYLRQLFLFFLFHYP